MYVALRLLLRLFLFITFHGVDRDARDSKLEKHFRSLKFSTIANALCSLVLHFLIRELLIGQTYL